MIQLKAERRENVEIAAGAIMSAGGIAGALTTALWGGFGRNNGYYFAMIITAAAAGAITMPQVVTDNIWGRDVPVPCGMLHNPS